MEAPPVERRLAAILAADVEGYSRLMHGDEDATLATLSAHRGLVDHLIAGHRGRIANTAGDSVLAEFASVIDAVSCAIAIQNALAAANEAQPDERRMQFRIGINVGDVMLKDGDVFGDGVNVAARLEGLVKGGEICVSRGVRDHLRHRGGMLFDDLGEQLVKNIAHPVRAFRLRTGEEGSEEEPAAAGEPVEPLIEDTALALPQSAGEPSADSEIALELAFWDSVKDADPEELENYLEKYPEGNFAALARTRLEAVARATIEAEESAPAAAAPDPLDLAYWNSVKDSDRREELEAYLQQHPDGHFAGLARARLSAPDPI
jgi:adenylate cyclase